MTTFGTTYTPLMARVERNRHNPNRTVAFIERQLCFFDPDTPVPDVGQEAEVMITGCYYGRYPKKHPNRGFLNLEFMMGMNIRVVDRRLYTLVAIDGFIKKKTSPRILSFGRPTDGSRPLTRHDVYPEKSADEDNDTWLVRKNQSIWVDAGCTGVLYSDQTEPEDRVSPVRPMNVWVKTSALSGETNGIVPIVGLTRPEDGEWYRLGRWHHNLPQKKKKGSLDCVSA